MASRRLTSWIAVVAFFVLMNVVPFSYASAGVEVTSKPLVKQQKWARERRHGKSRGRNNQHKERHAKALNDIDPVPHFITILNADQSIACTGVLIAADWVLTVANCFCNETASRCKTGASSYIALFGADDQAAAASTTVKQVRIHPNFNGNPSDGYDFAAIHLDESIPDIDPNVRAIPILLTMDLFCHDTIVEGFSWSDDGSELLPFVGNTSADTVGQRGVQVWNAFMNKTVYDWVDNCTFSDCEPSIVVAHGMGDEFCALDDGAPLLLTVNGTVGLVGLYSWSLKDNNSVCAGKMNNGKEQAPQYFAQAAAAIPFLQAVGARIRVPIGSVCGDGRKGLSEQCDDGNTVDGDGCSSMCTSEHGWLCATYNPSNDEVCWESRCSKTSSGAGSKSGIVTGAIVGGIVGAIACGMIPFVLIRRRRNAKREAARGGVRMTPSSHVQEPVSGSARNRAKTPGNITAPPPTPANGVVANSRTPTTVTRGGTSTLAPAALTGVASTPAYQTSEAGSPTTAPRSSARSDAPNRTG